jgi:heptaprenyl diphosphate synthase
VRRVTRLGYLVAVGTSLFVIESAIPLPLPFLKIGLANVATLLALLLSGPVDALIVSVVRIVIGSLLTGSFFGPSFLIALSAGLASTIVMSALRLIPLRFVGPYGLSLAGSSTHVLTQLLVVAFVFARTPVVVSLLPLLLLTGLAGGVVVGVVVSQLLPVLAASDQPPKTPRLGDIVIALVVVLSIAGSLLHASPAPGKIALVLVDGKTVARLELLEDQQMTVRGIKGTLLIETLKGKVRIVDADCPNHICVQTGWRSHGGEVIVCVPNKTVVKILTEGSPRVTGITG